MHQPDHDPSTAAGALIAKLDVDSATTEWQDLIFSDDYYYFYPAVTVAGGSSGDANIGLFMSYTGPTTYVSGAVKVYTNQPTDASGPFWTTANGQSSYLSRDSNNRNRWGDYSDGVFTISLTDLIFSHGFEGGDFVGWSAVVQ